MPCPQDDLLQSRHIQVDKFSVAQGTKPSVQAFFLTHAHTDHMRDLKANFGERRGSAKIFATRVTARLAMITVQGLEPDVFSVMEYHQPYHPTRGVTAWAFPAYHCDGSCMFLFEVDGSFRILYTGDFRWNPQIRDNNLLLDFRLDRLYYDDFFDEVKETYPTYAESYAALRQHVVALQLAPQVRRIFINASILGVEPMLRELSDELGVRYSLSDSLHDTWRGRQLEYLLEHRLTCDNGSPVVLGIAKLDDTDQPSHPWLIPTCTYFLCGDEHKKVRKAHHIYIQFCTHSNAQENTHLKVLLSARQINPCGEAVRQLTCRDKDEA